MEDPTSVMQSFTDETTVRGSKAVEGAFGRVGISVSSTNTEGSRSKDGFYRNPGQVFPGGGLVPSVFRMVFSARTYGLNGLKDRLAAHLGIQARIDHMAERLAHTL